MSVPVWCEFVCAICAATSDGEHDYGGRINMGHLRRRARGWHFSRDEAYCCKDHYDRRGEVEK